MRRVLSAIGIAVCLVTVLAAPVGAFKESSRRARWVVVDVSRDARSVVLAYAGGGCQTTASATVRGTPVRIHIRLDQRVFTPEAGEGCTKEYRTYRIRVRLRHPIGGRFLVGHGGGTEDPLLFSRVVCRGGDPCRTVVPRVKGFAPRDAVRTLRQQGFASRVHGHARSGHRPRIVAQSPRPERAVSSKTVTLRIGG